jgi:hypothetical protein
MGIAGCGGNGDGGSGGGPVGGGGGGESAVTVNLPAGPGLVNFIYLTGQGRAADPLTGIISQIQLTDNFGTVETQLEDPMSLPLNRFTSQLRALNVPASNSRLFKVFRLNVTRLENAAGTVPGPSPLVDQGFPANIRVFPGRQTTVPVFLNDGMFRISSTTNEALFDREQFKRINYSEANRIEAFLGDYVRLNIASPSFVGAKPKILATGADAGYVYFSGDRVALSESGTSGRFEVLTDNFDNAREEGFFGPNVTLPGGEGGSSLGSYALEGPDPSDLSAAAKITSLQGIYREFDEVLLGLSNSVAVSFPNVNDDEEKQQFVLASLERFTADGKSRVRAKSLYVGLANFKTNKFTAYPISTYAVPGSVEGEVTGTLSGYRRRSVNGRSVVLTGNYAVQTGTLAGGIPRSGTFTVFRR